MKNNVIMSNLDKHTQRLLLLFSLFASSVIILIVFFIVTRGMLPFITDNDGLGRVSLFRFLTGTVWLRGATFVSTAYGAGFLVINTLYVVFLSLLISFPVSILSALFIAKICPHRIARIFRMVVEILTAIPSIIFGLVGAGLLLPMIYTLATTLGYRSNAGLGVLGVVIVLALMSIPTLTTISETAIRSVDRSLEEASYALGATRAQTNAKVVLVSAKGGIFAATILAVGRALGEATAVSLVAGNAMSGPSFIPFDITATLTSMMLMGLHETSGIDYDIRFSLGIVLLAVIFIVNVTLNFIKKRVGDFGE